MPNRLPLRPRPLRASDGIQTHGALGLAALAVLAALLATALVLSSCGKPQEPSRPSLNVLTIIIDDLRPDLGGYGHPLVHSPNLDRLIQRSIRFERAYCQFPVCNPSRSSFLTGTRPGTSGVVGNETHFRDNLPDVVTLPELFRGNGFTTVSIGKVFHGAGGRKEWANPESWDRALFPRGKRRGQTASDKSRFQFESGKSIGWVAAEGDDEDQTDGQVASETVAALEELAGSRFFLAAGFLRPHTPLVAPKKYFELYPLESLRPFLPPPTATEEFDDSNLGKAQRGSIDEQGKLEILRAYYACISFVDTQVGRILEALDRLELWDNTIVVLVSDHGVHLGERDWWSKNTLSEVSARVPFTISVPGPDHGGSSTEGIVELIDLYPTLTELVGIEAPRSVEGRSLVPLLEDPDSRWEGIAHTQVILGSRVGRSIRTDRWRYVEWSDGSGEELYDHDADPGELVNLAGRVDLEATVAELRALRLDS